MCFVHLAQVLAILRHFRPAYPRLRTQATLHYRLQIAPTAPVFVHIDKRRKNYCQNLAFGYDLFTIILYNIYVYFCFGGFP